MRRIDPAAMQSRAFGPAAVVLVAAAQVHGAEFEAQVRLGITYTDNVAISEEDAQDDIIYRVEPSFRFFHETPRLTLHADYLLQAFRYSDLEITEVYHQYQASVLGQIVPEKFTVEVGARRQQSIVDPELQRSEDNLPVTQNRQDRDEYYITPRFQQTIGNSVDVEAEATAQWIENSGDSSRNAENRDAAFTINNYRIGRGLTWALNYDWQRTEYDNGIPWEYQRAAAEVGVWLGATTRIFGTVGLESAWDNPLDSALEDEFWEAGFAFQYAQRFAGEFAVGERSFGSSWRGNLDFLFKRGSMTLSYSETPSTQSRVPYRRGTYLDDISLEDLLNRPGATDRFILKSLQWRLNLEFPHTRLALVVFDDERSDQTTAIGEPVSDEDHRGVHASIGYELGSYTLLFLRGLVSERQYRDGPPTNLRNVLAGVQYELGARTTLLLQYYYTKEESEPSSSERDYVANSISLFLTRTF
jgi:hypothetical protein